MWLLLGQFLAESGNLLFHHVVTLVPDHLFFKKRKTNAEKEKINVPSAEGIFNILSKSSYRLSESCFHNINRGLYALLKFFFDFWIVLFPSHSQTFNTKILDRHLFPGMIFPTEHIYSLT